jgi:hypothetical protein
MARVRTGAVPVHTEGAQALSVDKYRTTCGAHGVEPLPETLNAFPPSQR